MVLEQSHLSEDGQTPFKLLLEGTNKIDAGSYNGTFDLFSICAGEEPLAECGRTQRCAAAVLWHQGRELLHGAVRRVARHWGTLAGARTCRHMHPNGIVPDFRSVLDCQAASSVNSHGTICPDAIW